MAIKIENLKVKIEDRILLDGFSLDINDGEIHAIMGPNGTGKSTLSKVIMAHPDYQVLNGTIIMDNEPIDSLTTDERAKKGIFLAMQSPISIEGVTNSEFLRTAKSSITNDHVDIFPFLTEVNQYIRDLKMDDKMLSRSINEGFSGGERKKNEVLQLKLLKPKFIILDEIDSGLDVDSLRIVAENINKYKIENPKTSLLIITHYPRLLEYIHPDFVHIMANGKIVKTGDASLALIVEKEGYSSINEVRKNDNHE